ncbi:Uncharacterised protein [Burkholderia pseudomallei]|nr:Uncharacterised protein [Burkholderia pseudomallei]
MNTTQSGSSDSPREGLQRATCLTSPDETVSRTGLRYDVLGMSWVTFQPLPQMPDINSQIVMILGMRRPPHRPKQLVVRHQLIRVPNQLSQ